MPLQIIRVENGLSREATDELAVEEPLEIRVRGRPVSITMRTPGHDDELAAGFLFSENIIQRREDILRVEPCARNEFGNTVDVQLGPLVGVDFDRLTRHVFASSSCGICGKVTIDAILKSIPRIESDLKIPGGAIANLPVAMREKQSTFDRTGGLHAAALFDCGGKLIVLREDVGRHNAVDKVIGHAMFHNLLPLSQNMLLVSGRASFEIMQKSAVARIPIVAAVSAPSTLAVQFAQESNQTLIGFLRGDRMNIYAHAQRVAL